MERMNEYENPTEMYARARDKAKEILSKIDPDIRVELASVVVTPDDENRPEYKTLALRFSHASKPVTWTMEIEPTMDYIENRFEGAVRRTYEKKIA